MRLRPDLLLLSLLVCTSAFGELKLGPERPLSAIASAPSVASPDSLSYVVTDGDEFLAVETQVRSGLSAVIATRISADGEILDPLGIVIAADVSFLVSSAAWSGESYTVKVWNRDSAFREINVRYFAVTPDGRVSPLAAPRPVARSWPRNARGETIEFSSNYSLLWFIDANGRSAGLELPKPLGVPAHVIPDGDDWIILFDSGSYGWQWGRFNAKRGVIRWFQMFTTGMPDYAYGRVAVHGTTASIAWVQHRWNDSSVTMTGGWMIIDRTGAVTSTTLFDRKEPRGPNSPRYEIGAAADEHASYFIYGIPDDRDKMHLFAVTVRNGREEQVMLDGPLRHSEYWPSFKPLVVSSASRHLLRWKSDDGFRVTTFDHGGTPGERPPALLSLAAPIQSEARGAAGSSGMLTLWRETAVATTLRMRFTPRNGVPGPIADVSATGDVRSPRIAYSGGIYAVTWFDAGSRWLFLRCYDESGKALGNAISVASAPNVVAYIEPHGDGFRIAFINSLNEIWTLPVSRTGALGTPVLVASATLAVRRDLAFTSNGSDAVVAWLERDTDFARPGRRLLAARVAANGTVGATTQLLVTEPFVPAVAANDDALLVAWRIPRTSGGCIYVQRFALDGWRSLGWPEVLTCHDDVAPSVNLIRDGQRFWAWTETSTQAVYSLKPDGTAEAVFDVIPPDAFRGQITSLFPLPAGVGVLYTRVSVEASLIGRAFLRTLTDDPPLQRQRSVRK